MKPEFSVIKRLFRPSSFKAGIVCIIFCCLVWYSFGYEKPVFFSSIDSRIVDAMFRFRGPEATTGSVVIVDIDEKSLKEYGQWPWPRDLLARLTRDINSTGAKIIGFDILFAEKDRTSPSILFNQYQNVFADCINFKEILEKTKISPAFDHDKLFGEAIASSTSVLGYLFLFRQDNLKGGSAIPFPTINISLDPIEATFEDVELISAYRSLINIPELSTGMSEGFINAFPDPSGTVRKVPLFIEMDGLPYPSLPFEMVRIVEKIPEVRLHLSQVGEVRNQSLIGIAMGRRFIRTDGYGQLTVNYRGGFNTFPYISACDILKNKKNQSLRDKYVLVGSSAAGVMDIVATPFSVRLPGVEVHANVIDNLIRNDGMIWENYTEIGMTYFLIVTAGLFVVISLVALGPILGFSVGLVIIFAVIAGNYYFLFLNQQLLGVSFVFLSLLTVFITVTFSNYFFEGRRKLFVKRAFSQYLSPSVVNELLKTPGKLNLSIENKEVTILFCDIRNFTRFSETTPIAELGSFLNNYLSLMTDIIIKNKGMVDKYIGDAVMAVWGSPMDDPQHGINGVRTALEMVKMISKHSEELRLSNEPIEIGIGINSGYVSAGNFGSDDRFDYTVLGDNVNLASRIEKLTKYYQIPILISEQTCEILGSDLEYRFIDNVIVRGRNKSVVLYEP